MSHKIIYIKPEEEITSVIDKLIKIKTDDVFLVIPKNSAISQSLVNLKLLKREADNLGKNITIVSGEPSVQRIAKKIDFLVADSIEESKAESQKGEDAVLKEQIPSSDFQAMLKEEKRPGPLSMVDIVKLGSGPHGKLIINQAKKNQEQISDELPKEEKIESNPHLKIRKYAAPKKKVINLAQDQDEESPEDEAEEKHQEDYKEEFIDSAPRKKRFLSSGENIGHSFSIKIFAGFVVSALAIAGIVIYLVLPKAEIKLTAKREKIPVNLEVSAENAVSQVNLEAKKIPAQIVKLEERQSLEFQTTGERQLNEKAKGTILVFNAYSSVPQALVETTRFLSKEGKVFRLIKNTTIPGAKVEEGKIIPSSIAVEVEADQAGSDYNIGASDFTIPGFQGSPKYTGFYGKSDKAMSGGSTEKAKVLTQDDFDKAKESIWGALEEKVHSELIAQIPANFKLLEEAVLVQMGEAKSSVAVGDKAESFSLEIKGVAKAFVFSEEDISQLIKQEIIDQLDSKKELSSSVSLKYEKTKADFNKGTISFEVAADQEIVWKINEDEVKKTIVGQKEEAVKEIFSKQPEIEKAQVSLWPFWIRKIPKQTDKITLTID
ncbi:MAG: hypothetical protein HY764_01305 [Candidatus Portnoybacteria bacterium]|nr:hypothetical protein [Candidatus Portnoybacteria bacterium]